VSHQCPATTKILNFRTVEKTPWYSQGLIQIQFKPGVPKLHKATIALGEVGNTDDNGLRLLEGKIHKYKPVYKVTPHTPFKKSDERKKRKLRKQKKQKDTIQPKWKLMIY
jgi:hypothetical protein